jgi:glycosyltransferase involved in cell wall biosynthesis
MKILHIASGDLDSGAGKGTYWLHKGLIKNGIQSSVLVQKGEYEEKEILVSRKSKIDKVKHRLRYEIDKLPTKFYRNRDKYIFSTGVIGEDITKYKEYKEADIVHFHWINSGFIDMKTFSKIKKPIVWTLRDMWPFTGGCHYSNNCMGYTTGCGNCTHLSSGNENDLSRYILNRKEKFFQQNLYLVGISKWISDCAQESKLFSNHSVQFIPNCIDEDMFFPEDKVSARKELGFSENKNLILFGAISAGDVRKGGHLLKKALEKLPNKKECELIIFGNRSEEYNNLGIVTKQIGFVKDANTLRKLYSAADVFVAPSLQEAFGKTIAESIACGTPAISIIGSGPDDIIINGQNGYLIKPESAEILLALERLLKNKGIFNGKQMYLDMKNRFGKKNVSNQYANLYSEILRDKK